MSFVRRLSKEMQNVDVVLDIGSRWGEDARRLKRLFPSSKVYAFEPTPSSIVIWKKRNKGKDITLIEKAVCDYTGTTKFMVNNPEKTVTSHPNGNQGANSLFKCNPDYPYEKYFQDEMEVPCTTLQDWALEVGVSKIDLVWMDAQGAELLILKGMGSLLNTVRAIHTEVGIRQPYLGQPVFDEVDSFLKEAGLKFVEFEYVCDWFADANYIRE